MGRARVSVRAARRGDPSVRPDRRDRERLGASDRATTERAVAGGPGYAGFEVWFRFSPTEEVPEEADRKRISSEQLFTLQNSWYVGPRYLEKYGIEAGKRFPSKVKVIRKGTCTPMIFELKTIDSKDQFESRSQ